LQRGVQDHTNLQWVAGEVLYGQLAREDTWMAMTKKDFIDFADQIRIQQRHGGWRFTPEQLEFLANFCQSQNSQFKRDRWLGYISGENGPNGGAR
jgi:hypothetical protein